MIDIEGIIDAAAKEGHQIDDQACVRLCNKLRSMRFDSSWGNDGGTNTTETTNENLIHPFGLLVVHSPS